MIKAKELTKPQLEQLCRVYDFLISLAEREQNLSIDDKDEEAKSPEQKQKKSK